MAEYLANENQTVGLNSPLIFTALKGMCTMRMERGFLFCVATLPDVLHVIGRPLTAISQFLKGEL